MPMILRIVIIVLLLAINFTAWWFGIMAPDNKLIEFTNIDLLTMLNALPGFSFDLSREVVSYRASHLEWLGLFAAWPLLLLFGTKSLTDFKLWQRTLSCVVRVALLFIITLALVDIESTDETQRVSLIYLVDVSDSVPDSMIVDAQQNIENALKTVEKSAKNHTYLDIQLVTYAATPRVVNIKKDEPLKISRHEEAGAPEQMATDLESAIRFASSLFPENYQRRIVIMGDGNQTQGDALAQAARAESEEIRIDVINLDFPERNEILLTTLDAKDRDNLRVGKPFEIVANIESTKDTKAKLNVSVDDVKNDRLSKMIDVKKGTNEIPLTLTSDHPGKLKISAELTGFDKADDTFSANNHVVDTFDIQGRPKVLYIEQDANSAQYLQRALAGWGESEGQNFDVDVRPPTGWPTSMNELNKYAVVILGDVPRVANNGHTNITSDNMSMLESYVRKQGGGFIALGGENSFGLGGYKDSTVEKILPISFDAEAVNEKMTSAIALLIDKSGSMDGESIELAKEAAKSSVSAMKEQDRVLVIGFDDQPYIVVPTTRAVNRYSINDKISRITADGGTDIRNALELAYLELSLVSAKIKHVILLTDGYSDYDGIDALVREMSKAKITVSTVGMGSADTTLLNRIASLGKGRSYIASDASSVPRIFAEETDRVVNRAVIETPFIPKISKQHAMVKGVTPQVLLGYVQSKSKKGSEVILTAPEGSPVLAHWNLGAGSTTAFTSDAKNRWASAWIKDSRSFAKFWAQVVRETMKDDEETLFNMSMRLDNSRAYVIVDAVDSYDNFINSLDVSAKVQPPEGDAFGLKFEQVAPGYYEAAFDVSSFGTYEISADLNLLGENIGHARSTLPYPYPPEYAAFTPNKSLLSIIAATAHGFVDPDLDQLIDPGEVKLKTFTPVWPNFLWIAFFLILLDVALRRIKLSKK